MSKLRVLVIVSAIACCDLNAKEVLGPTYPIVEKNMLEKMMRKLDGLKDSGSLDELKKEAIKRSINSANNPTPTQGLSKTEKHTTWLVDPSYIAAKDITTPDGKIVARAGEKINPLDYVPMSKYFIFFKGSSQEEIQIAKSLTKQYEGRVKLILEDGSPTELSKKLGMPVYFDQFGALVRKFGIRHTPAMLSQEGRMLRIDEIVAR